MVVYRRHCNCRQLLSSLPMIRHRHCLCFIVVVICILHSMSLLFCSRDRISCFIVVLPQHRCNTFNKKLSAVCTILHDYLFTVAVSGVMTAVFFRGLNCLALSCSEFWGCRPCPQPENRSCLSPIPYPLWSNLRHHRGQPTSIWLATGCRPRLPFKFTNGCFELTSWHKRLVADKKLSDVIFCGSKLVLQRFWGMSSGPKFSKSNCWKTGTSPSGA